MSKDNPDSLLSGKHTTLSAKHELGELLRELGMAMIGDINSDEKVVDVVSTVAILSETITGILIKAAVPANIIRVIILISLPLIDSREVVPLDSRRCAVQHQHHSTYG